MNLMGHIALHLKQVQVDYKIFIFVNLVVCLYVGIQVFMRSNFVHRVLCRVFCSVLCGLESFEMSHSSNYLTFTKFRSTSKNFKMKNVLGRTLEYYIKYLLYPDYERPQIHLKRHDTQNFS